MNYPHVVAYFNRSQLELYRSKYVTVTPASMYVPLLLLQGRIVYPSCICTSNFPSLDSDEYYFRSARPVALKIWIPRVSKSCLEGRRK
jgi:hypothetical protein